MIIKYSNRYEVTLFLLSELGPSNMPQIHARLSEMPEYSDITISSIRNAIRSARTSKHVEKIGHGAKNCKFVVTDKGLNYVRNHMNEIEAI